MSSVSCILFLSVVCYGSNFVTFPPAVEVINNFDQLNLTQINIIWSNTMLCGTSEVFICDYLTNKGTIPANYSLWSSRVFQFYIKSNFVSGELRYGFRKIYVYFARVYLLKCI